MHGVAKSQTRADRASSSRWVASSSSRKASTKILLPSFAKAFLEGFHPFSARCTTARTSSECARCHAGTPLAWHRSPPAAWAISGTVRGTFRHRAADWSRRLAPPAMRAPAAPHVQRHHLRTVAPRFHGEARARPRVMRHRVNLRLMRHRVNVRRGHHRPAHSYARLPDRSLSDATAAGADRSTSVAMAPPSPAAPLPS